MPRDAAATLAVSATAHVSPASLAPAMPAIGETLDPCRYRVQPWLEAVHGPKARRDRREQSLGCGSGRRLPHRALPLRDRWQMLPVAARAARSICTGARAPRPSWAAAGYAHSGENCRRRPASATAPAHRHRAPRVRRPGCRADPPLPMGPRRPPLETVIAVAQPGPGQVPAPSVGAADLDLDRMADRRPVDRPPGDPGCCDHLQRATQVERDGGQTARGREDRHRRARGYGLHPVRPQPERERRSGAAPGDGRPHSRQERPTSRANRADRRD